MVMAQLSRKNQIVIPKEARQSMGIKSGDKILVQAVNGVTILLPVGGDIIDTMRGFSKGIYPMPYLAKERRSW